MKIFDQHVHSYYSFDSEQKIEEYIEKARENGLEFLVLTDHIDLNYLNSETDLNFDIKKQQEELKKLQNQNKDIKFLKGIEIGYTKTSLKRVEKLLSANTFDLINLSVHENGLMDFYYSEGFIKYGVVETLKNYFATILESLEAPFDYDVVCHIDFGFKTAYLIDKSLKLSDFEEDVSKIMREVIKKDKTLEINTKVQSFINDEHTKYLLSLYKKLGGVNLTLSSDAHKVDRFYKDFDHYIKLIKDAGFDHLNYFIERKRYDCKI